MSFCCRLGQFNSQGNLRVEILRLVSAGGLNWRYAKTILPWRVAAFCSWVLSGSLWDLWVGNILHNLRPQDHGAPSLVKGLGGSLYTKAHTASEGKTTN